MPDADQPDQPDASDPSEAEPPVDADHRPDGLDLARAQVQGTAGAGGTPAVRRPRGIGGARGDGGSSSGGRWRRRTPGPQLSGAHPDGRDPQTLDVELGRLVADRGWGLDLRVRGVFGRWEEIVGPEVAAHSTPESLTDGRLVVRTDSTAWATQLRLLAPSLVRRLGEELGDGVVIVVEVVGPQGPSWKHGRRGLRDGRGPRDTYG